MKDLIDAMLIIGVGISTFIIFSGRLPSYQVMHAGIFIGTVFLIIRLLMFIGAIYWKKILIEAFAQQVCDEISRTDIQTPITISERMKQTMLQFAVEGLALVYREKQGAVFEDEGNEAEVLSKTGQAVVDFNEKKFKAFLSERGTLRWAIDGLDALIGNHKSIDVSWEKGLRYANRFLDKERRNDYGWFPSYMKVLGLPHNYHSRDFEERVKSVMTRKYPKGYISLWIATRAFDFRSGIKLFNLKGEEAWLEVMRFKADTLDFEELKGTYPSRARRRIE